MHTLLCRMQNLQLKERNTESRSQNMASLLQFSQINKNDIPLVGGKAASLGEMTKADIPVPPGFVITTEIYKKYNNHEYNGPCIIMGSRSTSATNTKTISIIVLTLLPLPDLLGGIDIRYAFEHGILKVFASRFGWSHHEEKRYNNNIILCTYALKRLNLAEERIVDHYIDAINWADSFIKVT